MALMTSKEYIESLARMKRNIYFQGKKIENPINHPLLIPSRKCLEETYDMAFMPEYEDLITTTSQFTGHKINRFNHIHRDRDDLIKKVKMQRLMGQRTGSCFQRCVIMDMANAFYSTTYEIDKKYGTHYFDAFKNFIIKCQEEDLIVAGALTDPKGDRSAVIGGEEQDKDLYLHVVERREDGVIVNGAKCHLTGITNAHEVVVLPTQAMRPGQEDYAVAFHIPLDAEGITMIIGRQSCDTRKMEDIADIDLGNAKYGGIEALTIFDNVFVPNENLFLNGETDFAGMLVERFAGYHRNSYGGCKAGVGDVAIGAASLIAQYNGTENASHVKDKLVEMTQLNEQLYCAGIASSCEGWETKAGNYMVDLLLANVCKLNVTRYPYEIVRLLEDIAGGIMVTAPSEADLRSPEIGHYVEKYLTGHEADAETRLRALRLCENLALGTAAVGYRTESMHGAGSPQAQKIMITRQGEFNRKKDLAKHIAGIAE
ncbi:4-hydroxyphenylacetate 3-hydroxylase family protein [Frisingicoccus sp.]|uniref:4-hydroxyphenylacetate 3-hydroxylase family protein n=1 Tax=Frisingicoccus sp. TaxID=1918627 RepID=UPI003999FA52